MQPYFFPYAQQFRHVHQCDMWVVFDTPKFSRKSWISRNRIINKDTTWSYISVPVAKGASGLPICQAEVAMNDWKKDFWGRLRVYENATPHYTTIVRLLEECLQEDYPSVAHLNTAVLALICSRLGIDTEIVRLSELSLDLPTSAAPGEWACLISKALGASFYSNAPGGRHLFDFELYERNKIVLEFYEPAPLEYDTPGFQFVPDLSIIDTLMWIGPEAAGEWCDAGFLHPSKAS